MSHRSVRKVWLASQESIARVSVLSMILLLVAAAFAPDARADNITFNSPTSFQVGYNFLTAGGDLLTATGTYNVTSFSSSEVLLGVTINNTTSNYVVSSVGFNTNPAVTASLTTTGSVFGGVANDTTFPNFQTIQVCAFTSSNCSSSANGQALQANSSDSFVLKLTGAFNPSLTLSTFAIKFAGGPGGSFEFQGSVPVPGTLLLFGVGFTLFAVWYQRSNRWMNALS